MPPMSDSTWGDWSGWALRPTCNARSSVPSHFFSGYRMNSIPPTRATAASSTTDCTRRQNSPATLSTSKLIRSTP